ncbi:MAG: MATE family efflux transporter [Clostridia bacterium]
MDKRIDILKNTPIPKAIITMALPAIIGMMVMAIYNIVDTMFVAWLGTNATGATQVVYPLVTIITAIGLTIGIGGGSYISRLLGQNKQKEASSVVSSLYFSAFGIGIVFMILGLIFLRPLLTLLGASESIMAFAYDYGFFILLGSAFQITNMALNNMLRAEGSAKNSMIGMMSGALLNIALDPIFIFGLGLGIKGAAIATSISQLFSTVVLSYQYFGNKSVLKISFGNVKIDKNLFSEVFKIGTPSFFRQLFVSISLALVNNVAIKYGGEVGIAGVGIVMRTMTIVMFVIFGLGQGFQPVAGYNYGAGNKERLLEAFKFTLKASFLVALSFSIVFILGGKYIFSIFRPTEEVLTIALSFMRYFLLSLMMMSISNVIATYYQALGKAGPAFVLSVARQGIFFIPALIILPSIFQLRGLFYAQPLADAITLIASIMLFLYTERNTFKQIESEKLVYQND